jgi:ferredoxin
MPTNLVRTIFFSPTRTTARIVEAIAQGTRLNLVEPLDLTPPANQIGQFEQVSDALTIIGAPVYGGRVAPEAARRLRRLRAAGTPTGIVVVYGNRAFEDALLELRDLATESGFIPIAAAAFIGEHSYSTEALPIAHGRPDALDLAQAQEFGGLIRRRLDEGPPRPAGAPLPVPGDYPYRDWVPPTDVAPITDATRCTHCETCAAVCPTAAISVGEVSATDAALCILCTACVKSCPTGARTWQHPRIAKSREWLSTNCRARKSPEMYL